MFDDKYKNILVFGLYLLFRPSLLRYIFSLHLPTYIQLEWLLKWKVKTFIDVGAHEGQEIKAIKMMFPQAKIFAFEPQKKLFQKIYKYSSNNIIIINSAVGNESGRLKLIVPNYTPGASILQPIPKLKKEIGELSYEEVDSTTLDEYFNRVELKSPVVLKIDTQGYELNVLRGADLLLKHVDILYIETPLVPFYKHSSMFSEINELLVKRGFVYHGNIPDSQFWPKFTLPTVQNSIYIKKKFSEQ